MLPVHSCLLGDPNSQVWPGRPPGIVGRFFSDGRIVFDRQPAHPWEFMATGTGVTGLAVTVDRALRVQINHASSFDGQGWLRNLGVLQIDYDAQPWAVAESLHLEHDLRRSLIQIVASGKSGRVRVEIRAHVELDVIRIDLLDEGATLGEMMLHLAKDYPHEDELTADGDYLSWHTVRSSVYEAVNRQCGFDMEGETPDFLLQRCFGTAMRLESDGAEVHWGPGLARAGASARYTLWIAGAATLGGVEAWRETVSERLAQTRSQGTDGYDRTHEAWWQGFWQRACFEPEDPAGRFTRHRAAFDLYRYYVACSSSDRREVPVRFQNDLFRYNSSDPLWSLMDITSIETYQAIYGAMRTGDLSALHSRLQFYPAALPILRRHSRARFGHGGAVCPYETNVWGSFLQRSGQVVDGYTEAGNPWCRYSWQGNLWMLLLMCDYVLLSGDEDFAEHGLRIFAEEVLTFFAEHYPGRKDGRIVFFPSEAGETWSGVRNSAELIVVLEVLLPRLIALGRQRGWSEATLGRWSGMLGELPPVPLGRLQVDPLTGKCQVLPGDLLVPAEDLAAVDPPCSINRQHTELYCIWPARVMLGDEHLADVARRSFEARYWQHITTGWALDVVLAAALGLDEEVSRWFDHHFEATFTFPCGLAQEESPMQRDSRGISIQPSMQGLGTGVLPVLEMLLQDTADRLVVLPCWPREVGVRFVLYSPFAGRVEAEYQPDVTVRVKTERPIAVEVRDAWRDRVQVIHSVVP